MTNAEKYLRDGVDGIKPLLDKFREIGAIDSGREYRIDQLLRAEVKPTLTEDEKVILRNISKKYELIGREERLELGKYNLYIENINYENEQEYASFDCFNDLFQFIKPRRRIQY